MKVLLSLLVFSAFSFANTPWNIDPTHSTAKFKVKHLTISNVYGQITGFKGTVTVDDKDTSKLTTEVTLDANTINTSDAKRDTHLKSADFFDTGKYPAITFKSKKVTKAGDKLNITGDLTMHGVTKEVTFKDVEVTKAIKDPWGNTRRGLSGTATINRKDFGITWNKTLDGGGLAVGDTVDVNLEVEMLAPSTDKKS